MCVELKKKLECLIELYQGKNCLWPIDFLEKHLSVKEALKNGVHLSTFNRMVLLNKKQPYYIIGDLHSDEATLKTFLDKINFYERAENNESFLLVFLGDYVDRGLKHLETLECLVDLKLNYPDFVCLLRGNHDGGILLPDGEVKLPYRILDDENPMAYFPKYLQHNFELLGLFLKWFDLLPYVAFVGNATHAVMCVHGGIIKPKIDLAEHYEHIQSLADLTKTEERCDALFWSDPYSGHGERHLEKKRFKFTEANYMAFKEKIDIDCLIRGHEVAYDGVRVHFDGSLFTLFSSGLSEDTYYQSVKPRYMMIDKNFKLSIHSIHEENAIKGLHTFEMDMPQLETKRTIRVWVPRDYDHNLLKRYPVIYMHDGQNLFDKTTSGYGDIWDVHTSIEKLMDAKGFEGAIVVGIDHAGGTERLNEYSPWISDKVEELKGIIGSDQLLFGGKGDRYAAFIVDTLKPVIDLNYRTKPQREHTAIMGSSMGGLISLYMGVKYPDVFSKVGAFSTASWFAHDALIDCLKTIDTELPIKWYLDVGTHETSNDAIEDFNLLYVNGTLDIEKNLKAQAVNTYTVIEEGAVHNEVDWARRLPSALEWLFK